ncbi:F0F1 ATP synthase subunit delta [Phaeovibrio sulfidiphilus]|uniref:ATP synthase subunit delta n=1 Tax=Phaeovibrio sulfidiphilus TaxID=1220600 RepID=A0A8J7CPY6_9PROT|nr:F0F1 ATP synthase subunit delta [Phaeovibrio sulfidiphilus]
MSAKAGASRVAERYALALYELARGEKRLDAVEANLNDLSRMLEESPDLRRFVASPVLSRAAQVKGLEALADKAGFDRLTRSFLGVLALHRRSSVTGAVIDAFRNLLRVERGEVMARVSTATPLSEEQEAELATALRKELRTEKLDLTTDVDPSLLGGMVVRVGSRMVDSSLRTKLKRLHFAMKGIG